ncbi:putative FMN/FAD exporter YeeO [Sinobacterium norvegicum]|uniref:Multidrug-efflux transporter n=1 Tax=Sinobacterium norvegicum TaxID=1641715 RepID=A0ABM9AAM9_9GAMM|nr:putative FMN/FAD exporter YeeO [Sinobacterium norvegicum]
MQATRQQQLLALGLPISAGMLSQSLLSLVDISMVARLNDANALAAVGIGSYASFLAVSLIIGIAVGVQAIVARRAGANQHRATVEVLNGGLLMALLAGLLLTLLFYYFSDTIITTFNSDKGVQAIANPYYDFRILGIIAVGINFAFRGYWNGIKQSMTYMKILLVIHLCNFALSYVFIFGGLGIAPMGAPGSGLGTTVALYIGTVLFAITTFIRADSAVLFRRLPTTSTLRSIVKLATPNSLQQLTVALGVSILYWIIGQIGVDQLAVAHAIINITLFIILPGTGMGIAATTLVGSALGKQDVSDAYRWGWDTVAVTAPILAVLGLPLILAPEWILSIFLPSDPALIALGTLPLQISGAFAFLQAFTLTLPQSLNGAGDSKRVMLYSIALQWLVGLPLALAAAFVFNLGLIGIWSVQIIERIIATIVYTKRWRSKKWQHHKL